MDFLKSLPDDQLALLGCFVALLSTGGLMSLSYFVGRGRLSDSRLNAAQRVPAVAQVADRATVAPVPAAPVPTASRRRTAA
jgi:hypothetical protein